MIQFQQSESTAARRRWILVLVDSADGVTGLTGQTGTVFISKNGGAGVASTNSIVEVDAGDMPGHYYLELTAAELDTLGWISITKKTASSLAFHDRAIVSYNDPYVSTGGFSGGTGSNFKLTKKHIESIAEAVWKYMIGEDITAQDKLLQAAEHPITDLAPVLEKIDEIKLPETDLTPVLNRIDGIKIPALDLSPILNKIAAINIPAPISHSAEIQSLAKQINDAVAKLDRPDPLPEVTKIVNELSVLQDNFDNKITAVLEKDPGVTALREEIVSSQEDLKGKLKIILEQIVETRVNTEALAEETVKAKFDILEEITK